MQAACGQTAHSGGVCPDRSAGEFSRTAEWCRDKQRTLEHYTSMKAIVKNIDTGSDVAFDAYHPADEECFGRWLTVLVGPENEEGGHLYQVLACTPEWIQREFLHTGAVWGRHMLIVSRYDQGRIRRELDHYVEGCTGDNFWEIAQKVARIGAWEFEDYQS